MNPINYRAFVVRDAQVEGERKNLVMRSNLGVNLSINIMGASEVFLVEGERKYSLNWLNRQKRGSTYKTAEEFIGSLKVAVEHFREYTFRGDLEEFARSNRLSVKKLLFVRNNNIRNRDLIDESGLYKSKHSF